MIFIVFIFGLVLGSFYNVCIYRLPVGKSIVAPRSSCGVCNHELSGLDMVPVLSYVFSKGKCRHCGSSYSMRYALVELLTGTVFSLVYLEFGYTYMTIVGIVLSSIIIIVTFIDIDHHIILDRFSFITIALAVVYHLIEKPLPLWQIILGMLVGGGLLFLIAVLGTMGGGDIKIMACFGLLLGFPNILIALYLAFVIGALCLMPKWIYSKIRKKNYNSNVPFGPFLGIGTWIVFMYGTELIDWYVRTLL